MGKDTVSNNARAWPDFRVLAENVPAVLWSARPDGTVEFVNRYGLDFFGRTFDSVKDWNWVDIVHPDDLAQVGEAWSKSLETGEPYEIVMRFLRVSDGSWRPHRGRAVPLRDENGKIVRWLGAHIDLAEGF